MGCFFFYATWQPLLSARLLPMGLPEDVTVIAWGIGCERWTALLYNIRMIKDTSKSLNIYLYTYIYMWYIHDIHMISDIQFDIYIYIYTHIYTHVRLRVHIHTQYRIFLIYINMLKIHRWTGGWVFSRIQELFSFQQDVAATKKNPMCWLRRAEAEQNMTGNLVPLNTPTTHGNS